jgi:molybdate transport system ATP-binding protein
VTVDAHGGLRVGDLDLHITLHVEPGEVVALLGPNGAGKTTMLRCLAGLTAIDRGRITLDGVVVDDPEHGIFVEPPHRNVGVVFQHYVLFEHMSVRENVAYGMRARGTAKATARRCADDWLGRLGLDGLADRRPPTLSGGQAQRVALARALAVNPRLLLLDEPLAALDAGTRGAVRRDLRDHLATFDGARILVTHDPVDAFALADRVAIVEAGRIVQDGSLADVTARPRTRYVADLVGTNLVSGHVDHGVLTTQRGATLVIADASAGPAFAVIAPRSIVLSVSAPATSVRNTWPGTITAVDRLGERVRVSIEGVLPITAEITPAALADLGLDVGVAVYAAVKATDITAYPA